MSLNMQFWGFPPLDAETGQIILDFLALKYQRAQGARKIMADATSEPTENALVNEPYERVDRLNYKGKADDHIALQTQAQVDAHAFANQTQAAIVQQQREGVADVRAQRDQLFAQFLQLNANSIDMARGLTANTIDLARRTAADAQTMSVKELQPKETNEVTSESIGAKVAQEVVPEINNAVKMAAADVANSAAGAQGLTAYNTSATTNLGQLTATMLQAAQALQEAAKAVSEMNK